MNEVSESPTLSQRFWAEMRHYAWVTLYLLIAFGSIHLYTLSTAEEGASAGAIHVGSALIKALVLGKFILIGEAIGAGTRVRTHTVFHRIVVRTLGLWLALIIMTALEELVVGLVHGQGMAEIVAEMVGRPPLERFAPDLLMLVLLVPLVAFVELAEAIGWVRFRQVLFGRPAS